MRNETTPAPVRPAVPANVVDTGISRLSLPPERLVPLHGGPGRSRRPGQGRRARVMDKHVPVSGGHAGHRTAPRPEPSRFDGRFRRLAGIAGIRRSLLVSRIRVGILRRAFGRAPERVRGAGGLPAPATILGTGNRMKHKTLIGAAVTGIALAAAGPAYAAGDAEKGKVKAITCMGCHGIPGYHNAYPQLPGAAGGRSARRVHRRRAEGLQVRGARPCDDAGPGRVAERAGHAGHRGILRIGDRRVSALRCRNPFNPHRRPRR